MTPSLFRSKISLLVTAWLFAFLLQDCTKESEQAAPTAAAPTAQDCLSSPPPSCKSVSLIAGQNTIGTVDVGMNSGDVYVTYKVTKPNAYLTEAHLDLFSDLNQFRSCSKLVNTIGAIPSRFLFGRSFYASSRVTSYTFVIPRIYLYLIGVSDCFKVAAHAEVSSGENAWGGLCRRPASGPLCVANCFPGTNGSSYFEFCKSECTDGIDFTYAWEDLVDSSNDSDYNDLVVQADVVKSASELKINFLSTARGASFDHKFKFKIPKAGITGIYGDGSGDVSYTDDGTYYYVTVFESTKTALPASPGAVFANTQPVQTSCTPFASKQVTLTLDNTFAYNSARPYEPFISVYRSGDTSVGVPVYDLYVYSISNRDAWTATNGKSYPNGIVIPSDWRWPLENVNISTPYPNFTSLTDGFTPTWANNLAVPAQTFSKNTCN